MRFVKPPKYDRQIEKRRGKEQIQAGVHAYSVAQQRRLELIAAEKSLPRYFQRRLLAALNAPPKDMAVVLDKCSPTSTYVPRSEYVPFCDDGSMRVYDVPEDVVWH